VGRLIRRRHSGAANPLVKFAATRLDGVFRVEPTVHEDERGTLRRVFDAAAFAKAGLCSEFPEHSIVTNRAAGTLRGLHYQTPPYEEAKVIRCLSGRVFDVIVDLRRDSPTFGSWISFELDAAVDELLYVPEGCAHGYQTLTDDASLHYLISQPYHPEAAAGIRFDDPALAISWPLPIGKMSARDRSFAAYSLGV